MARWGLLLGASSALLHAAVGCGGLSDGERTGVRMAGTGGWLSQAGMGGQGTGGHATGEGGGVQPGGGRGGGGAGDAGSSAGQGQAGDTEAGAGDGGTAGEAAGAGGVPATTCEPGDCENGGCRFSAEDACVCPAGFKGQRCEHVIRDCTNDGACTPFSDDDACADCRWPQIAVGAQRSCLLQGDGSITCWGSDFFANGHRGRRAALRAPSGEFVHLALGEHASCALDRAGTIRCWGQYFSPYESSEVVPPSGEFVEISTSAVDVCGLTGSGSVVCSNGARDGTFRSLSAFGGLTPDREAVWWPGTSSEGRFLELSAGPYHACGINQSRQLECWGADAAGQASPPTGAFVQVSVGERHGCGVRATGQLACWGDSLLTEAPSGAFMQVAAGEHHSCALNLDAKVHCWGAGNGFELHPPLEVAADPPRYTALSVAGNAVYDDFGYVGSGTPGGCGLTDEGKLDCFGEGLGEAPAGEYVQVSVGQEQACAIRTDGGLVCWGGFVLTPEDPPVTTYRHVSTGLGNACAVRTSGELECLNLPRPEAAISDVGPPPSGTFSQVSLNPSWVDETEFLHPVACALSTTGDMHCWGSWMPAQVFPGPFVQVAAGAGSRSADTHVCALEPTGRAVCWSGSDSPLTMTIIEGPFSRIGIGRTFLGLTESGTVEGSDDGFVDLSVGADFACGLRSDGHLRCFGTRVR